MVNTDMFRNGVRRSDLDSLVKALREVLDTDRLRIAMMTSGERAPPLINLAADLTQSGAAEFVGVCTDDSMDPYFNPNGRGYWLSYPNDEHRQTAGRIVPTLCEHLGVTCYSGHLDEAFEETFCNEWRPDIVLVNVYGRILRKAFWDFPRFRTWGFHSCDSREEWPNNKGPKPLQSISRAHVKCQNYFPSIAMYQLDASIDGGPLRTFSRRSRIAKGTRAYLVHRKMRDIPAELFSQELPGIVSEFSSGHTCKHRDSSFTNSN